MERRVKELGVVQPATERSAAATRVDLKQISLGLAACLLLGAAAVGNDVASAAEREVHIRVLSNRADLISGSDALVEVALPRGVMPGALRVDVGGRDVSKFFAKRPNGRVQGVLRRLPLGRSVLTARLPDGHGARIAIHNHPIGGPTFAGRQITPWICRTEEQGLGPPKDAACNVRAQHRFVYRSTNPGAIAFRAYDPDAPPDDVALTTTDTGRTVPFVVRVESGVIDRGIYAVAVLFDPSRTWEPWAPQRGWNGKVLWPFGGDCKPYHVQDAPVDPLGFPRFDPPGPVNAGIDEALGGIFGNGNALEALSRGFLVADSALNKLGSQCNPVVSAEAISMLKEHIVETYGPIRYTIGAGGSGGAMQQLNIASAYPGLLDGLQPLASFPDVWSVVQQAQDCRLLNHYFNEISPHLWAAVPQQEAVHGSLVSGGCRSQFDGPHKRGTVVVGNYAGMWLDPTNAAGCGLDPEVVYDPEANRAGVRCTLQDYAASVFGRRRSDGFAHRPFDNVGVQYGLQALESGRITAEQFVDLNSKIGGIDIDWRFQQTRSQADRAAIDVAYRAGLITDGRALARVPIVDIRGQDNYEIHADFNSYVLRARLERAHRHHDNHVLWTGFRAQVGDPTSIEEAFNLVDEWLARIKADDRRIPLERKVRLHRPPAATDACWFEGQRVSDPGMCGTAFPYFADPRIVAGGPLSDDVIKCRLKKLRRDAYSAEFTDEHWARLREAFPAGVCDYGQPAVGQRPTTPWMSFADGPGGTPLGPAPRSVAF